MVSQSDTGNLSAAERSFVGRRREMSEVKRRLPAHRLVTLTGPAGVGKTCLAARVGADVQRGFHDGGWLADLATLTDPGMLVRVVAEALRVGDRSGRHALGSLLAYLRDRDVLLLLDNCDELRGACADLIP